MGRAEAEFALVVEGPLLVFGFRFGDAMPWTWAAPYNWHFAPPAERVVPAAVDLTPDSYARLWATLWITLVDAATGGSVSAGPSPCARSSCTPCTACSASRPCGRSMSRPPTGHWTGSDSQPVPWSCGLAW